MKPNFNTVRRFALMSLSLVPFLIACGDRPTSGATQSTPAGMVYIPGGRFQMGINHGMMPDAQPIHDVVVNPFWMGATEVTNREYAEFVDATGYVTLAERPLESADYPGADPALLRPGSVVFQAPARPVPLHHATRWWSYVQGANWRHPEGPQSSVKGRMDHPVVHIAWADAVAYAQWAGKRLPTEAEWEFAARGGLDNKEFVWGNRKNPEQNHMANTFQGNFPNNNTGADGYLATAPVQSFPPNGYGLYDMSGNAWEWVQDWYNPNEYSERSGDGEVVLNPRGPADNDTRSRYPLKVQKGGSFLCTDQFCARYRPGARGKGAPDTGNNHVGFRLVKDVSQ